MIYLILLALLGSKTIVIANVVINEINFDNSAIYSSNWIEVVSSSLSRSSHLNQSVDLVVVIEINGPFAEVVYSLKLEFDVVAEYAIVGYSGLSPKPTLAIDGSSASSWYAPRYASEENKHKKFLFPSRSKQAVFACVLLSSVPATDYSTFSPSNTRASLFVDAKLSGLIKQYHSDSIVYARNFPYETCLIFQSILPYDNPPKIYREFDHHNYPDKSISRCGNANERHSILSIPTPFCPNNCTGITIDLVRAAANQLNKIEAATVFDSKTGCYNHYDIVLLEIMYYNEMAMKRMGNTSSLQLFGMKTRHKHWHRHRRHRVLNRRAITNTGVNEAQCAITSSHYETTQQQQTTTPQQQTTTTPQQQTTTTPQQQTTTTLGSNVVTECTWIISEFNANDPLFVRDMVFIELRSRCPATKRPHKDMDGMRLVMFEELGKLDKKPNVNGTINFIGVTTRIIGNIYLDRVKPNRWSQQSVQIDSDFFLTIGNTGTNNSFSYLDSNNTLQTHIPDLSFKDGKVSLTAKIMQMRRTGAFSVAKSSAFAFALIKITQDKARYMTIMSKMSNSQPVIKMTDEIMAIFENPLNAVLDFVPFSYGSAITNTDFFKRMNPLLNQVTDAVIIDAQVALVRRLQLQEKLGLSYCGPGNNQLVVVAMGAPTYWRSARATPGAQNLCQLAEGDTVHEIPVEVVGGPMSSRITHSVIQDVVEDVCAEPDCENGPSTSTGSFGDVEMAFGEHSNLHENDLVANRSNEAANSNKRSGSQSTYAGAPQAKLLKKAQMIESAQAIYEQATSAERNLTIDREDVEEIMAEIEDNTDWWDNNELVHHYSLQTVNLINTHRGLANWLDPQWFTQSWVDKWKYDVRFLRLEVSRDGPGPHQHGADSILYCTICRQSKALHPNAVIKQQQSKIVQGTFKLTDFKSKRDLQQKLKEHFDFKTYPSSKHWTLLTLLKNRNQNAMVEALNRANRIVIKKQSLGNNAATIKFLLLVLQEVLLNLPSFHHEDLSNHIHSIQMNDDGGHSQNTIHHSRKSFNFAVNVIDHYIRESFLRYIVSDDVKYISIISDGCTSRRSHHYVAILFRFMEPMKASKMWAATTLLYRLMLLEGDQTAEAHQQRLEETLQQDAITYKLPNLVNSVKKKLYSFASDGASVNLGSKNGWHKKMETWAGRKIIAQHDAGHKLELAVSDAWKDDEAFNTLEEFSQFIYRFVIGRRLAVYEEVAKDMEDRAYALLKIQATRWVASDHRALQNVFKGYGQIAEAMKIFKSDPKWSKAGRAKQGAEYILSVMKQRHFLPTLAFTIDCLTELNKFSKQVQTDKATVADTLAALAILKERISNLRYERTYGNFISSLLTRAMCSSEISIEPRVSCGTLYNWETERVVRFRDIPILTEMPTTSTAQEQETDPDDLNVETVTGEESEPEIVYFKRLSIISWKLNKKLQKALDERFPQNSQMAPLIIFERNNIENQLFDGNRSQLNAERAGLMATNNIIPAAIYLNPDVQNEESLADEYTNVVKELVILKLLQTSPSTYMLWSRALGEPQMTWSDGTSNANFKDLVIRFMTIPVGSAAAERVFSKTNRILTDSRNRLAHESLERITCIQFNSPPPNRINSKALINSWFKAGHKQSDTMTAKGPNMFSERELRQIQKMERITGISDHQQVAKMTWTSILTHDHDGDTPGS